MQKLWDWRENQNQVLRPRQNQGENKVNKSKQTYWSKQKKFDTFIYFIFKILVFYFSSMLSYLYKAFKLHAFSGISYVTP